MAAHQDPRPWDSPGKNTGVGCHFLLQCMKVKSESEVAQLCPNLHDPMDCRPPGSSIHGIFQARVLEWGAVAFSAAYLRLLIFLLAILIPACASSSPAFHMMYSTYKLNKQGDNIQPWHILCPIWHQSVVPCLILTVASWPSLRLYTSQVYVLIRELSLHKSRQCSPLLHWLFKLTSGHWFTDTEQLLSRHLSWRITLAHCSKSKPNLFKTNKNKFLGEFAIVLTHLSYRTLLFIS